MKTRRPPCLEWREKLALRHEDLSPADQLALDAHVHGCEFCSEALADYHFFEARLDALPPLAIKPLPRLSPHFFEHTTRGQIEQIESPANNTPRPASASRRPARKHGKITAIFWRTLSIAAVICLLLGAGAVFRVISLARQASHPSGDTLFDFNQHTEPVYSVGWSPDGNYIATASSDHTVKVWNAHSGNLVCTYTYADAVTIYALAWAPNSQLIASGGDDNAVQIWNATTCTRATDYATYRESTTPIMSVAWSHNGAYLAAGNWYSTATSTTQIWDAATGKTLHTFPTSSNEPVKSLSWSSDDQKIAAGSWGGVAQIWNVQTEKEVYEYDYTGTINAVALSPNGLYLAIGRSNATVVVANTITKNIVCIYTQHTGDVNAVAWSPDGKYLASGSNDKKVRVWNPFLPSTPTLMVYAQHTNSITSVAWSPDGKEIVSGSYDNTAKVWVVTGS